MILTFRFHWLLIVVAHFYKYQSKSMVCYRRLLTPYDRYKKICYFNKQYKTYC